jgi:gliding motility-associated-like protein
VQLDLTPVGVYVIEWNGVATNNTSYTTTYGEDVFISVEDENGCVQDTSFTVSAHPDFFLQVTVPSTQCVGETGTLELNVVPAGSYTTEWNGEGAGEDVTYDAQAGSDILLVVKDAFGCERDTIIPFEAFPVFNYELTNASIVCPGEPAVVEIDYTPSGNYTVLWNGTSGNPNVFNAEAGSLVSISISDEFGCQKDTSLTISSYPIFNLDVVTPAPSCPGESATVTLLITPSSTYTVEWNGEVGNQSNYVTESGSEVSIQVTDEFGCIKDTSVMAEAFAEPVASFSIQQIGSCIPFEESSNITIINNSVNGQTGTWDFGDGQTSSFSPGIDVVHGYAEAGTFELTLNISTADGCTDTTTQQICVLPEEPVFIPDIFSPNEDGRNDTLYVRGKLISRLEFRIYSRWGEVVFEAKDVSQGWDGKVRGEPAPSGSYYYTITATIGSATRVEEVGEIVLIR